MEAWRLNKKFNSWIIYKNKNKNKNEEEEEEEGQTNSETMFSHLTWLWYNSMSTKLDVYADYYFVLG